MRIFKHVLVMCLAIGFAAGLAYGQSTAPKDPPNAAGQPPAALTDAELGKIKAVLAPYKSATLTADEAKLIKRTLRDAGLRRSPALDAALNAAGFNHAKLDQLDPPPPRPADGGPPPPLKK